MTRSYNEKWWLQADGARVDGGLARGGRGVRGLRDAPAGAPAGLPRRHAGRRAPRQAHGRHRQPARTAPLCIVIIN